MSQIFFVKRYLLVEDIYGSILIRSLLSMLFFFCYILRLRPNYSNTGTYFICLVLFADITFTIASLLFFYYSVKLAEI